MKYLENGKKAVDLKIAYVGGGSRGWARGLMSDLASESAMSGTVYLYDIDYEAAKANEQIGNAIYDREDVLGKWHYKAVKTLGEALDKADFVVISILPGTFDEMESDVHLPEKYGMFPCFKRKTLGTTSAHCIGSTRTAKLSARATGDSRRLLTAAGSSSTSHTTSPRQTTSLRNIPRRFAR